MTWQQNNYHSRHGSHWPETQVSESRCPASGRSWVYPSTTNEEWGTILQGYRTSESGSLSSRSNQYTQQIQTMQASVGLRKNALHSFIYLKLSHQEVLPFEQIRRIRRCGPVGRNVSLGVNSEVSKTHARPRLSLPADQDLALNHFSTMPAVPAASLPAMLFWNCKPAPT